MDRLHNKQITQVQPDLECFRLALQAAARRPQLAGLGTMVDTILTRMQERFIMPDGDCYEAAMETWRNEALRLEEENSSMSNGMKDDDTGEENEAVEHSVRRTLELFAEAKIAHNQSSDSSVQVSTAMVNHVLTVLAVSRVPKRMDMAGKLLKRLEKGFADPNQPQPNFDTYRLVMNVWKSSPSADKVPRALADLWRAKDQAIMMMQLPGSKKESLIEVFNAFVGVCSSIEPRSEEEGQQIFRQASHAMS